MSAIKYWKSDSSTKIPDNLIRIPHDASQAISLFWHNASGRMDYLGSQALSRRELSWPIRMSQLTILLHLHWLMTRIL